jgi:hypothetical protein
MPSNPEPTKGTDLKPDVMAALAHRSAVGGHRHHRSCIHNMTPEEQVTARGRTVEYWQKMHGSLPRQITPDEWEIEEPEFVKELGRKLAAKYGTKEDLR